MAFRKGRTTRVILLALALGLVAGMGPASLRADGKATKLTWNELGLLDYQTGKYPAKLRSALERGHVQVTGYVVPAGVTDWDHIEEFLLIPWKIDCCNGPPPHGNQIILVSLAEGVPFDDLMGLVALSGTLSIEHSADEYGYVMGEARITPAEYDF